MCSAMEGHSKVVSLLLHSGAGDEVKNLAGQQAIDLARFWGEGLRPFPH